MLIIDLNITCQTASGSVPAPLYTELLAAYLADGELIRLFKKTEDS